MLFLMTRISKPRTALLEGGQQGCRVRRQARRYDCPRFSSLDFVACFEYEDKKILKMLKRKRKRILMINHPMKEHAIISLLIQG